MSIKHINQIKNDFCHVTQAEVISFSTVSGCPAGELHSLAFIIPHRSGAPQGASGHI